MEFIVPIDFSVNAENALKYASSLALAIKAKIKLLHIIHPTTSNAVISGLMAEEIAEQRTAADRELVKLIDKMKLSFKDLQYSQEVRIGNASDQIIDCAKSDHANIIVMGTNGASGLKKLFFGSNTSSVIEKAHCPVMAVPGHCSFISLKKIIFATNYYNSDLDALENLAKIAEAFSAEINVLHIVGENEKKETEEEMIKNFLVIISRTINYKRISCKVMAAGDISKGLGSLLESDGADMLALSSRKRRVFENVFDKSITKELSFHSEIPLLAFSVNESESNNDSV